MACEFEVLLNAKQYPHGAETAVEGLDLVDQLESQLTVYRDDSEISLINRDAREQSVEVEPRLFALLERAAQIHRDTGGAYDITSGPLSKAWGFYRREGKMPSDAEIAETLTVVGMQHLQFDAGRQTVQFDRPGVEINLGSIGKGYALDRLAELLRGAGIDNFLLHGGNSSVLAAGPNTATTGEPAGWWIGLRHPLRPEKRLGQIRLRNRAVGTSGSGTQFFIHEGRRLGHILDPRTGRPAEGTLSVTVAAATGADADALATALYVLGPIAAADYCRQHPELSAIIMSRGEKPTQANVTLCNVPENEIQLEADPLVVIQNYSAADQRG
jgi:thiamine biosynthesis lipoprotein